MRPDAFVFRVSAVVPAYNPVLVLDSWERVLGAARAWVTIVKSDGVFDPMADPPRVVLTATVATLNPCLNDNYYIYDEEKARRLAHQDVLLAFMGAPSDWDLKIRAA